ncbi:hypothetical protein N7537_005129 [Penicillium hordei]|uniref:BHLH domain-containing protein n=1 Tax=Penicillium hordei TaxID=40994 RepID=A0AAD6ECK3_9EURO|nr:uncharacterized protein N7537_005129 [Penicillium hordei]KAJ5608510.1 hypothetical protein N7537_005129 [Penicillium hordei]
MANLTPISLFSGSSRRERLVTSMRALIDNDNVDPDILKPGTPWPSMDEIMGKPPGEEQIAFDCTQHQSSILEDPAIEAEFSCPVDLGFDAMSSWQSDQHGLASYITDASPTEQYRMPSATVPEKNIIDPHLHSDRQLAHTSPRLGGLKSPNMTLDSWELFSGGGNESQDYTLPGREARDHKATPDGDGFHPKTRKPWKNQGPSSRRSPNTTHHPPKRQRSHYVIEKKYRAGLQERFEALRGCVMAWNEFQRRESASGEAATTGDELSGGSKMSNGGRMNKAEVLSNAVTYIQELQEENEVVIHHLKLLIRRLRGVKQALQTDDLLCTSGL